MKKIKKSPLLGKVFMVIGSVFLAAGGMGLLLYFAGKSNTGQDVVGLLIGAIIALVLGVGTLVFSALVISFPEAKKAKEDKQKNARYAALPLRNIYDYKIEINKVRANFSADANPEKNKIAVMGGITNGYPFFNFSVLRSGKIYYAHLVEANEDLFHHNHKGYLHLVAPAVVIYGTDEYFDSNPTALAPIAAALFADRENNILRDEMHYFSNLKLSPDLTGGRDIYMTTLIIDQALLPMNMLLGALFPVIADPACTATFIVEDKYWTDNLLAIFIHGEKNIEPYD